MELKINQSDNKEAVFQDLENYISAMNFTVAEKDFTRPWGGFFVLAEQDAEAFISHYFPGYSKAELTIGNKLSPKFLVVAPGKRLSWQYHHRRAEIWRVLKNSVQIATSHTDVQDTPIVYEEGKIITLKQGERHRLIGDKDFGIVAEIWQHTDINHPSNEDDIIRLQDDFGR